MTITLYVPTRVAMEAADPNFLTAGRAATSRADAVDRLLHLISQSVGDSVLDAAGVALEGADLFAYEDFVFAIVTTPLEIGIG